ncbi:hypothetical protein PILCRDRAFT_187730 [Piloderma croceum F 1598]|uniref:Uncharacterized protein n=1 Tax=Piloderma croceum (strain F 1598) TaxID=765440 RepID=A0A0C3GIS4_PILCF|nr:hypothetical protein PILCRDRAFT_187730 [Piloderma croceum F 1598]
MTSWCYIQLLKSLMLPHTLPFCWVLYQLGILSVWESYCGHVYVSPQLSTSPSTWLSSITCAAEYDTAAQFGTSVSSFIDASPLAGLPTAIIIKIR